MRLSVLVAAAIGVTAGFMIWHGRQAAREEHLNQMKSMGVVLAEQTARYVQVIDLILLRIQARIATLNITTPADFDQKGADPALHLDLVDSLRYLPQAYGMMLFDADGYTVSGSLSGLDSSVDVADRDYYQYFQQHDDPGIFVGVISKGRNTGNTSLVFARRINGPGGVFCGLVVALVDIRALSAFYKSAGEETGQTVTLLRRDGALLLRYPDPQSAIGVKLPLDSPWHARVAEGGGTYRTMTGVVVAVPSLVSVHPLRDYPLVVDVLMAEAHVFAHWRREAMFIAGFALAAAAGFTGLFRLLARQFGQQAEQNVQLAQAAARLREGQEILRSYAGMAVDWLWEQNEAFRFRSEPTHPFLIVSDDAGKTRWDVGDPAMDPARWDTHKADLIARRPFRDFRWERIAPNGERRFISASGEPVFDRNGGFIGYRGTGRDITTEIQASERLARANAELERERERFDLVLSNITQGICFFDGNHRLLLWNRRYPEIYDLAPATISVGCTPGEILQRQLAAGSAPMVPVDDYFGGCVAGNRSVNATISLQNGRCVAIFFRPMPDGGWVATHEDVTERHRAEASIAFMAHHDALTKLPNRVLFRERMEQALAATGRGSRFAVICLDLDNFKYVNDTMGHPVGDGLLIAVADRLRDCVREGDTVARLGGDEFAIIQLDICQPDNAEILVSRIIAAFRQPFDVERRPILTGTSIGIAMAPGDGASYEMLMRHADTALYLAKTEGRGTARFFEPEMDARIHLRRLLELDLQGAITRNELELYYQPQLKLSSNRVSGFEALLRWNHPDRGMVSPLDFIPVAEETGLIVEIGEWVLQAACSEAESWPDEISVAVNLSPVQFKKGNLVASVQAALDASGLRPNRLELEITESVFLRDTAETLAALHELREIGICVSLDDFGTGYSSLSYLRSFPFNKIKIDQSFVRGMMTNKESLSIIRAVTGLGNSLGMMTIAEGVETPEQLRRLREEGCTEVQGYLFSRPRPASEVPALIERLQHIGEALQSVSF